MDTFLAHVAEKIKGEHPEGLEKVTVVFNNRRSGIFLRQWLMDSADAPFFLPRILGMDDLISEWSGLEIVRNELLVFELYDIYRQQPVESVRYDCFDEFMPLGDMMLADFSEVDLYCVDALSLFSNVHEIKSIGEWDIETGKLTPFQLKYLQFYKSLYSLYSGLRERLFSRQMAYSGMAYRIVSENISAILDKSDSQYFYFVGFNALSSSEEMVIRECVNRGVATLCTDGDLYYYDDPQQEAGFFLRKNAAIFPGIGDYENHFASTTKTIHLVNCPENVLQCKCAGYVLNQMIDEQGDNHLRDTAVVLADEELLLPVLNSLPAAVKSVNVTMGLPITDTAAHAFVLKLFSLHIRRHGSSFYHQDILNLLSDTFVQKFLGISNMHSKVNRMLYQEHVVYVDSPTLSSLCWQYAINISPVDYLFDNSAFSTSSFLTTANRAVMELSASKYLETNPKEKEAMSVVSEVLSTLCKIQEQYQFIESLPVLQKIYVRLVQNRSVAFYGKPVEDLQVLGVLETRNLDFKRLVILSANEGILPAARSFNSLIPYNLKVAFGLPTFHEKDAVYAYNFYRLLQRAGEVYILYSTEADSMGKGEPSRFIQQIRRELATRFPDKIKVTERVVSAESISAFTYPSEVEKNPGVMARIIELAQKGISPSALNKYRGCPMKFYYENVLRIEEADQVNADLEQNELGSCIHSVLETVFSMDSDKHVKPETLGRAIETVDSIIDQSLSAQFGHGRVRSGKNHFFKSVAKTQIVNFLKSEIRYLENNGDIEILALEQSLSHTMEDNNVKATIIGIADRIDKTNGIVRVIDYKSGKVEEKELYVAETYPDWRNVSDKWFQLMVYEWLYHHAQNGGQPHVSGIFPLRYLSSGLLTASWESSDIITPDHLSTFEDMLKSIVSELLNPSTPFYSNPGCKMCAYCPFDEICNR